MAIRAHADDIKFNAASTLLKYYEKGYEVIYVQSTNNMSGTWSHLLPDGTKEVRIVAWSELMPQRKLECEKAAKGLIKDEMPLQDVITAIGYSSSSFFFKIFKRCTAMTPKEYLNSLGEPTER